MAVPPRSRSAPPAPLDAARLQALALRYVGRYATTRARLAAYLARKLGERGWADGEVAAPAVDALVARLAALGYVDDRAYATSKAAALTRRGYGVRRIGPALRAAGIGEDDLAEPVALAGEQDLASALAFARRRRIGPFATAEPDRDARRKALAALLRAGHGMDVARRILAAEPGVVPTEE